MKLLIDGDPIVYRAGFAGEATWYVGVYEEGDGMYPFRIRAGEWLAFKDKYAPVEFEKEIEPEPVQNVLQIVNTQIASILHEVEKRYAVSVTSTSIILSGPGNYRERIAKQRPYKGNRDPDHKPYHYQAIRDYLTRDWGAIVVHGREADDELSILGRRARSDGQSFIIATIDKDLDQVPGLHYDYLKKTTYSVADDEAELNFWIQVVSGDGADNVPGAYKMGPKKAEDAVWQYVGTPNIWKVVVDTYRQQASLNGCPYKAEYAEAIALETAQLVYMQRTPNELWTPTGVTYMDGDIE